MTKKADVPPIARHVCIFCGSNPGKDPLYSTSARELAKTFVKNNFGLVYGGASVGIMGLLADEVLKEGGYVQGVIPKALMDKEVAHSGISKLYPVATMHDRKKLMYDLSDAFLTFPGGFGTLDETFEILTWKQIGLHYKPLVLLNINGFFDPLIQYVNHAVEEGFIRTEHRELMLTANTISEAVSLLKA